MKSSCQEQKGQSIAGEAPEWYADNVHFDHNAAYGTRDNYFDETLF